MRDPLVIACPGIQVNYFDMREVGDEIELHTHPYGHFGVCLTGAVHILGFDRVIYPGDAPLFFPAGVEHGYRALQAGTQAIAIIDTTQPTFDENA